LIRTNHDLVRLRGMNVLDVSLQSFYVVSCIDPFSMHGTLWQALSEIVSLFHHLVVAAVVVYRTQLDSAIVL
jgi:hypothetical protein